MAERGPQVAQVLADLAQLLGDDLVLRRHCPFIPRCTKLTPPYNVPRMAQDDWRVRIELEEERHATDFLARIGLDLGSEARELAKELEDHRLAVSNDADIVFVYAATRDAARKAKEIVETELRELELNAQEIRIEHWLADEERWDDEAPAPDIEEELLEEGYAPWEVRIERESVDEAHELADQLEKEGYGVVRRGALRDRGHRDARRTPRRSPRVCTARSSPAASSSTRSRRRTRSPSSAASAT